MPGRSMRIAAALAAMSLLAAGCGSGGGSRPSPSPSVGLRVFANVPFANTEGVTLPLDAFIPPGAGPFPAVILLHPGGFKGGAKGNMREVAIDLAHAGFAAFAITYRLAPRFHYPAPEEDTWTALSYVRDNAFRYHVDASKIGLFGASAGATIALSAAATSPADLGVQAIVSWSGIVDLVGGVARRPEDLGPLVKDYVGTAEPAAISPIAQVSANGPPVLVVNARTELVPLGQAAAFYAKLRALGTPSKFLVTGTGHGLAYTSTAIGPTIAFLDQYLG